MSLDDIKSRFVNEIRLRADDDHYVDRNEEREILQIAIQLGVGIDSARQALVQVCEANQYVLESAVLKLVKDRVEAATAGDGKVDRQEFEAVFRNATKAMRGVKSERQVKTMIVQVMEDTGNNRVKTGWFRDWYAALKKDLGVA